MLAFPRKLLVSILTGGLVGAGLTGVSLATATPSVAAATVDTCYSYKSSGTKDQAASAPAVDCATPHSAQTFWVGTLPEGFGVPEKASIAAQLKAVAPCTVTRMNQHLGMPDRKLPSRFQIIPVFPTTSQWEAGERWVRCDVILRGGKTYKQFSGTAQELVASTPADTFNFCTPSVPGNRTTSAYPCTNKNKNWIMILEKDLGTPASKFPGSRSVELKTKKICSKAAKPYTVLKKFYPWWAIWPAQSGWKNGIRTAECFVPYKEFVVTQASR
jgi:hypothetical protein